MPSPLQAGSHSTPAPPAQVLPPGAPVAANFLINFGGDGGGGGGGLDEIDRSEDEWGYDEEPFNGYYSGDDEGYDVGAASGCWVLGAGYWVLNAGPAGPAPRPPRRAHSCHLGAACAAPAGCPSCLLPPRTALLQGELGLQFAGPLPLPLDDGLLQQLPMQVRGQPARAVRRACHPALHVPGRQPGWGRRSGEKQRRAPRVIWPSRVPSTLHPVLRRSC